jgi:catechol 2,3-dioxygenase-like lactoylglutathione lyase family enzyme
MWRSTCPRNQGCRLGGFLPLARLHATGPEPAGVGYADGALITGVHAVMWTDDADALRAFFRDVLELPTVDAGGGWLVFGLPPAEVAMHPSDDLHPADEGGRAQLYLMSDDLEALVAELEAKGVQISRPITDEGYGLMCAIRLPDGQDLGMYQPRHPTALDRAG